MKIKVKKECANIPLPSRGHRSDAGWDLYSNEEAYLKDKITNYTWLPELQPYVKCTAMRILDSEGQNIHDIYKPYADGDMMFELRMLLEACKIYDEDELVKIATTNGRKVLGISK